MPSSSTRKPTRARSAALSLLLLCLLALSSARGEIAKVPVEFTHTQDVGFGNEVFVLGDHPSLGGGDPVRARKMVWTPGNVWRAAIALPAGRTFAYRYIMSPGSAGGWCDAENFTELAGPFEVTVPAPDVEPPEGKTVYYLSAWEQPAIHWHTVGSSEPWQSHAMQRLGDGRAPGESLFIASGIGTAGEEIEFVFHDGSQAEWQNAPAPPSSPPQGNAPAIPYPYQGMAPPYNFRTALDAFWVQDGSVFNYRPHASPGAPRIEVQTTTSSQPDIATRPVRVYLPRGYDEHTDRHYPVVYFHDGQNIYFPGGPFGTWDADRIANYEIGQGRMREAILVAIDNTPVRLREYTPPGDVPPAGAGSPALGDAYAAYLFGDVKPWVDETYRTLPGREQTLVIGSSMGGLITSYMALDHAASFATAGIVSPSYWVAPNHRAAWAAAGRLPVRVFLSIGSLEGSESTWTNAVTAANDRLAAGHVHDLDLLFSPGCGGAHNEEAFSRQMAVFLGFALDPRGEPALLVEPPAPGASAWILY